jgi:hypothetical protein
VRCGRWSRTIEPQSNTKAESGSDFEGEWEWQTWRW